MNRKDFQNEPLLYRFFRPVVTVIFKLLFHPTIIGKENIPKDSAVVLAGNHTSFFDCFMIISATKRCVHFLAKNELFKTRFTNRFFTSAGLIRVYRNGKDKEAIQCAEKYLQNGCVVGIFPQGTTSKDANEPLPFKIGAVKMAYDTDTAVVPFTISGEYRLFRKGAVIVFHKPYKIKTNNLHDENMKLYSIVLNKIKNQGDTQ